MTINENGRNNRMELFNICLKSDKNRKVLSSSLMKKLSNRILDDSIVKLNNETWKLNKKPKILLIVPYYTRIKRSLDIILENIEKNSTERAYLLQDRELIHSLKRRKIENLEEMKRAGIPMGLLRVGTAARKAGYDVKIIDAVFEGWNNERKYFTSQDGSDVFLYGLDPDELKNRIMQYNPDIVGITCTYSHQWGNSREAADIVKNINPQIPIIMGGTHVNGLPEDALFDSPIDFVILGQADMTFPELLDVLTNRTEKRVEDVHGIVYRQNGQVQYTKRRLFMSNITNIACPDLSFLNLGLYSGKYHSAGERKLDYGYLVYGFSSFGCNTRCNFCTIPLVQGGWVSMKKVDFNNYINYLISQGVTELMIEDDHLLHNPKWAMDVFDTLKKHNMPWVEEGGVALYNLIALLPDVDEAFIRNSVKDDVVFNNTIAAKKDGLTTEKFIKAMAESNCYSIYLAVETANQEALETSKKPKLNANDKYTKYVVNLFEKYNIQTTCGLMIGFFNPQDNYTESRKQIQKSIDYGKTLIKAGATFVNPFIFTPLPGAPNFFNLKDYTISNTDEGFSHEFGSIDAPDGQWCRDTMSLVRVGAIIQTIGIDGYEKIIKTGTWPVDKNNVFVELSKTSVF